MNDKNILMRVEAEVKKHAEILAEECGLSVSGFIKQCIFEKWQDFLKRGGAIK